VKPVLPFLLSACVLHAAELTIDHVTVAGPNLKMMRGALAGLGVYSEYGGMHSNHATEMALVSFPDGSYLELIAIQRDADPEAVQAHYWSRQMEGGAGATAWAVRPKEMEPEIARLRAAGVSVHDPAKSGRARPDGTRLDWESAPVGDEPNGTFFPFLIHDITPRELRANPSGEPTNLQFGGISKVVIAVQDLGASIARYRRAYGLAEPVQQQDKAFGARLAYFTGTPVILASALSGAADSWIVQRIHDFGEGPCAFLLKPTETSNAAPALRPPASSRSDWFGIRISWFNPDRLGWNLGVENSK